ncbi:MAG: DUF4255 domain-containing protein [Devosia sp.]
MALSALALTADAVADGLQAHFGNTVHVAVDTPMAASEKAKGLPNQHLLNLFFYRISHSGFHAGLTSNDPLFLRLHCLVTPFPGKFETTDYPEMRMLGRAIQFLHGQTLFAQPLVNEGADATRYSLECTLLQPNMEEINHIWTTQGSELAYRLSAVYEFSLVPVEPAVRRPPGPPVRTAILDLTPTSRVPEPFDFGGETFGVALAKRTDANKPAPPRKPTRLPIALLRDGGRLTTSASILPAARKVEMALAGSPGAIAAFQLEFSAADGTAAGSPVVKLETIQAALLDDARAKVTLGFTKPNNSTRLSIRTFPTKLVDGENEIDAEAPFSPALVVALDGAGP